jgi:hypothetical protein
MSRGEAWERIRLLDSKGVPVDLPFLEIDQELWDPEMKRLTVLFDPGRIKRGVLPREELGPVLIEGDEYALLIDREWQDGRGAPLLREFRKTFRVGAADRVPPDPGQWKINAPLPGTRGPLIANFPEPMEWALLQRLLQVVGPAGRIEGRVEIGVSEMEWRLIPARAWEPGEHALVVMTTLEDLAGNRIGRAFDLDLDRFDQVTRQVSPPTISIAFLVGGE